MNISYSNISCKFVGSIADFNGLLNSLKGKIVAILGSVVDNAVSSIDTCVLLKNSNKKNNREVIPMRITYIMPEIASLPFLKRITVNRFRKRIKKFSKKIMKRKHFVFDDKLDEPYDKRVSEKPNVNLGMLNIDFILDIGCSVDDEHNEMRILRFIPAKSEYGDVEVFLTMNEFQGLEEFLVENKRYDLVL